MKKGITYSNNFLKEQLNRDNPNFRPPISEVINEVDNNFLLLEPSEVELKKAVEFIPIDSFLGPDSFGYGFFSLVGI